MGYFKTMLTQEPNGVKFEERGLTEENPVKYHRKTFYEDAVIRMHYHSSLEINFCKNVEGYLIADEHKIILNNCSFILLQPNFLHSYNISGNGGEIKVWHIGLNLLSFLNGRNIESYLKRNQQLVIAKSRHKKSTEDLLDSLLTGNEFLFASTLLMLFDEILESGNERFPRYQTDPFLQKIISYSEMNFHSRISLDDAASAVNLSRYHFCRKFKTRTGSTFNEYINNLRMEHSLVCLDKGMSVSETAEESGSEDVSYFIKRFRKMYGITPGSYSADSAYLIKS